jgi:hypothetical protein
MFATVRSARVPSTSPMQTFGILTRSRRNPEASRELAALMALRAETMRVSAVTVAATSIAVHLTRAGDDVAAQFSTNLTRPSFFGAAADHVETLTADAFHAELAQAWTVLNADLATANLTGEAARNGETSFETLRDTWQRACRSLLEWYALLQPLMLERGAISDAAYDAPTLAMLRRAVAGETPALNAHGPFALPTGTERRRETRHEVSVPVTITVGTRRFDAHLGNISARGLLVVADRQIPTGRVVQITLADDRVLEGKVCWSNVRQIGIALNAALAADDPLWTAVQAGT